MLYKRVVMVLKVLLKSSEKTRCFPWPGPLDSDQYFKKTRAKRKTLDEGKSGAQSDLIYNICAQNLRDTDQHVPEELMCFLKKREVIMSPFKLINTHNYNNALNYCLNSCCT